MTTNAPQPRKKLIEVALPLEEINKASAREKSIRHGHPSTLHLWWARRPLAACRAVVFAQLVDDPCAWPERFPSPEAQAEERKRLHDVIARMVPWEASNNEAILNEARYEIARSVAWSRGEEPPKKPADLLAYLQQFAPPVYDPFCGGGSIPLEAQRLGLRAYGSDLNPVAVLISKALVEIPPKFAGQKPINPETRAKMELIGRQWKGAQGLAEDVRYYGRWMREQAEKRIGHLYPKAKLADGSEATVIAWLWARTVRSPDPAAKGAHVPLASSFMLSAKKGKKAWVEVIRDSAATDGWRFEVRTGMPENEIQLKLGTKAGKGQAFVCAISGSPIPRDYIQAEGKAQRLGARLMAVVAEGDRERIYLPPDTEHEDAATSANALPDVEDARSTFLSGSTPTRAMITGGVCSAYGLATWGHLFTSRQLAALTLFSDLVREARAQAFTDARSVNMEDDHEPLHSGGAAATAYADAIATYLAFGVSRTTNYSSSLCVWSSHPKDELAKQVFLRQALPMTWDFAETNPFSKSGGSLTNGIDWLGRAMDFLRAEAPGSIEARNASANHLPQGVTISTDPPYYDNVGYADLSDFFYVWLRRSLGDKDQHAGVWPEQFRRLLVPKSEELVATPYRHGGQAQADNFFLEGMSSALSAMCRAAHQSNPLAIYYAFKQSEAASDGVTSAGWASFLQAVVDSGLAVDGTWPMRMELTTSLKSTINALASSIVLVCRKRDPDAPAIERDEFKRVLRRELPDALANIRAAGVGPVDMAQAAIGPGMGVFTRYSAVLEASGEGMKVKDALKLINEVRDEIEDEGDYDLETRFAVEWFTEAQWEPKESGRAILLANAKNLAESQLERAGIIDAHAGKTRLRSRLEIGAKYDPGDDKTPTVWEHAQALAYALEQGGQDAAAALFGKLNNTEAVRALAYRLYGICERKGWSAEALVWNRLAEEWRRIEDLAAASAPPAAASSAAEADLFGGAT
jgi:putative DNA methylase